MRKEIQPESSHTSTSAASPVASLGPIIRLDALSVPQSPVYSKVTKLCSSPQPITKLQTPPRTPSSPVTALSSSPTTHEPLCQPSLGDPFGLSVQHLCRPGSFEDDKTCFSCRPCGPRIYDVLNTLPLSPFGALSWFIVDREEEMFELNDILDEDKVIQALWGRWILLNRRVSLCVFLYFRVEHLRDSPRFLANYYQGTIAFIDGYWRIIHQVAGWSALRTWLLVSVIPKRSAVTLIRIKIFVVNRFLTGSEVAQILRHYEGLTKMNLEHS